MAGGRPTKYDPKFVALADEYIKKSQDETVEVLKAMKGESEIYDQKIKVKLPTIGGFGLFLGVPERTLYDWAEQHPEFSQSLTRIKQEQQERLISNGLSGSYNSTIAKLILSSNHGMVERKEIKNDNTNRPAVDEDPGVKELKQKLAKEYEAKRKALLKRKK